MRQRELAKTREKFLTVSRLEGPPCGGDRLHGPDCGCLCQCVLESYMQHSTLSGMLVATCGLCECAAKDPIPVTYVDDS